MHEREKQRAKDKLRLAQKERFTTFSSDIDLEDQVIKVT